MPYKALYLLQEEADKMKNRFLSMVIVLSVLVSIIGSIPVKAASVSLNSSKKTIYAGSFFQLKLKNASGNVTWKSNKESVAQVLPSGIVVALKKGKATITATYEGIAYGCTVTVKDPSIDKTKATMRVDDSLRLKMKGANAVSWSSSDKKVATVDDGGLVKALMVGTTKITAKCEDGREFTCTVSVKNYDLKVGDTVKMGHYDQDNNTYNGEEAIEWVVLDVKDGNALVITKDGLVGFRVFETDKSNWEDCEIRKWINSDFYESSFSAGEKGKIVEAVVEADINPEVQTSQGNTVKDKLFLLSIEEYLKYKPATPKTSERLISKYGYLEYMAFWLRTRGESALAAVNNGVILYKGFNSDNRASLDDRVNESYDDSLVKYYGSDNGWGEYCVICPAMWITVD